MPLEEYVSLGIYRDEIFPHHLQGKYYRDCASTDLQVKYKYCLVFLYNDDISSKNQEQRFQRCIQQHRLDETSLPNVYNCPNKEHR